MTGFDLFHQGGFIMYPLLIFSILAWTIGIYKIALLAKFKKQYQSVNSSFHSAISSNKVDDLKSILSNGPAMVARPHEVLLTKAPKDVLNERIGRRLAETNTELKQHLWVLGSISASAPFVGLFGTVVGIMESFKAIGITGKSGFSVVAAGISEALIATAAGIMVAVVALLFYNFLQSRVNTLAQDFRIKLEELVDMLTEPKEK